MLGYETLLGSDVINDGMYYELIDKKHDAIAHIFRCDADHTVTVHGKFDAVPLSVFEWFISGAKKRLDPFEDGTPLSKV